MNAHKSRGWSGGAKCCVNIGSKRSAAQGSRHAISVGQLHASAKADPDSDRKVAVRRGMPRVVDSANRKCVLVVDVHLTAKCCQAPRVAAVEDLDRGETSAPCSGALAMVLKAADRRSALRLGLDEVVPVTTSDRALAGREGTPR